MMNEADEDMGNAGQTMPTPETVHHTYPQQQGQEAHERLHYIQEAVDQMDQMHDEYEKAYQTRRDELMTMRAMCEAAINTLDNVMGPQRAVPSSQRPMDTAIPHGVMTPKIHR